MTPLEIEQFARLLASVQPGHLPKLLFDQVARLMALPILEIVPLRRVGDRVEVLLFARPANDVFWPSAVHTPGAVMHGGDRSLQDPIARVLRNELNLPVDTPLTFALTYMHDSGRGMEVAQTYWLDLTGRDYAGHWCDVNALPDNFVQSQHDFLDGAVAHYQAHYS